MGHPKSKTTQSERDQYATPPHIFQRVQDVLNIEFAFDVCATKKSSKCGPDYWNRRDNALKRDWTKEFDPLTPLWMNPPYSQLQAWTELAAEMSAGGLIVVGLVPDCRSVVWYQKNVEGVASSQLLPDGRINFIRPDGSIATGNMWPSCFPVWTPWRSGVTPVIRFNRSTLIDMTRPGRKRVI